MSPGRNSLLKINDLVRRHSLSLVNRTPPKGSLSAELLSVNPRNSLEETQKLIDDLKESLSDFGSCVSEVSDNDDRNAVVSSVSDQRENNGSSKKKKKKGRVNLPLRKVRICLKKLT